MNSAKKVFYLITDLIVSFLMYFVWYIPCFLCVSLTGAVLWGRLYPDSSTVSSAFSQYFYYIAAIMAIPLSFRTLIKRTTRHGIVFRFFKKTSVKPFVQPFSDKIRSAQTPPIEPVSPPIIEPVIIPKASHTASSIAADTSAYLKYGGVEAELLNIDLMEGHDFEHWCANLLLKTGFQKAEVTQASGDDGVDIIAVKDGVRYAVQCKCYSSDLGNRPVQEVHTGKSVYRCHVGAVMTNRYFTAGGKRAAEATETLLWDRDWIRAQLSKIDTTDTSHLTHEHTEPESDELWPYAVEVILETGQPSVSMLQRKMNLGYARAARIIDELEERGIVGPFSGAIPRSILITREQWESYKDQ